MDLIRLCNPGGDIFFLSMDSEFIPTANYPSTNIVLAGELGTLNKVKILCFNSNDLKQHYTLITLYEQGVKFSDDSTTQRHIAYLLENITEIKREYLISKL